MIQQLKLFLDMCGKPLSDTTLEGGLNLEPRMLHLAGSNTEETERKKRSQRRPEKLSVVLYRILVRP